MVSFNLKVLAIFGLCSNCSQNYTGARLFVLACSDHFVKMCLIAQNFVNPAL